MKWNVSIILIAQTPLLQHELKNKIKIFIKMTNTLTAVWNRKIEMEKSGNLQHLFLKKKHLIFFKKKWSNAKLMINL
jgi:hypothetical protein